MLGRPDENPYTSSSGSLDANESDLTPEVNKEPDSIIAVLTKNPPQFDAQQAKKLDQT
jgi:hypothetical protein